MVISWILNSVSKEISASIIYAHSAREFLIDLRDWFQQINGPKNFQLRRELMNLSKDQQSVNVYFTKLKTIWGEVNLYKTTNLFAIAASVHVRELLDFMLITIWSTPCLFSWGYMIVSLKFGVSCC